MARTIANAVQQQLQSPTRTDLVLCFLTVTDPRRTDPARIVCEESGNASMANNQFINYWLDGELFIGLPFRPDQLTDNDQPATLSIVIPAYDRRIGEWLRAMTDPGRMRIEYYSSAGWGRALDGNNARTPTGTPDQIYLADHLFIRRARGGGQEITVEVGAYDFSQEPLGERATQELTPDLFRR